MGSMITLTLVEFVEDNDTFLTKVCWFPTQYNNKIVTSHMFVVACISVRE